MTIRPASFFSATAIAASTTSRGAGKVEVEVDAVVDAVVEDGRGSMSLSVSGG